MSVRSFSHTSPLFGKFLLFLLLFHLVQILRSFRLICFPVVEILSALSIGLIIWYGGEAIISGKEVTLGELVAFILYIHMMFRPIRQLADRFNILQMGIVGSERVFKVLDTKEFISDAVFTILLYATFKIYCGYCD